MYEFKMDTIYNFNTISTKILEPTYRNLKVVSHLKYKQALLYSRGFKDVITIRQQLITETGKSLIESRDVNYTLFENQLGDEILMANDWVDPDSVIEIDSSIVDAVITITNTDTTTITTIMNTLNSITDSKIELSIVQNS